MTNSQRTRFAFGPLITPAEVAGQLRAAQRAFEVDAHDRLLTYRGDVVPVTPKALDILLVLLAHAGRVVTTDELIERVWPNTFVEPNNLAQNISALRKAFGERDPGTRYIETVSKRGYRLVAPLEQETSFDDPTPRDAVGSSAAVGASSWPAGDLAAWRSTSAHALEIPETRYARSGDVNIAYQVVGDGLFDLVFVMGWVSHLEYFWTEPTFARFLRRLASFSRLILFDKRGTGLSDRVTALPTLEQRMDDVRAVMEAVGSTRAALFGVSEGGPMCTLFAATYPEKTLALAMFGTYARRLWAPDYPWGPTPEDRESFYEEIRRDWGGPVGLAERAPSRLHDPQFREWWATYIRMGASPGAALALTRMNADIDVRDVLPSIRVPTLILHRSGDRCLRVEEGRYVAARVPGARFCELPGEDHLPFVGDQDALLDEIEGFITGFRDPDHDRDRVLATVLCAVTEPPPGAVGTSSRSATNRPPHEQVLALARREVERFRGRLVRPDERASPALLAAFDGPARAIHCGSMIADVARRFGCSMRLGAHTGECELMGDTIRGLTLDTALQVATHAPLGDVVVSRTVRDLVAGSGLRFRSCGVHLRPGDESEITLFRVDSSSS
ncbi:MAG: alpha/beta fold hydrolase [Vicinamibacteraceae bacterium]